MQKVLIPIEDNFRMTYPPRQIDFWVEFFSRGWRTGEILSTLRYVLQDCKYPPTVADWDRLRPKPGEATVVPSTETFDETAARLQSQVAPGSWPHFVLAETRRGLRAKNMRDAYGRIISEGRKRGVDDAELAQFAAAADQCADRGTL